MIATLDTAMSALAAAVTARRLYFADHPAVNANITTAHDAFTRVLLNHSELTVHAIDGRVVGPEGTLASSKSVIDGLFEPLRKHQRSSVRVSRGVNVEELRRVVEALSVSDLDELPALTHVHLGVSGVSQIGDSRSKTSGLVGQLKGSWASGGDRSMPMQLESVAAGICAAVAGARGTMLELAALKSYDEYTFVHTVNVAMLSAALAESCGLSPERVHQLTLAALLHDVGKRVIPLEILSKKGQLDQREREIMNSHPVEGARLLLGQSGVPDVACIVAYQHHMHIDGTGYPKLSAGLKPNLSAQIVQQADVFDALRTHRPYRAAMPVEKASAFLREGSGKRYDESLVEVFVQRVVKRTRPENEQAQQGEADQAKPVAA